MKSKLTPSQYSDVKTKWASGDFRLIDLAKEYGISPGALTKRFKKDNIKKGEGQNAHKDVIAETINKPGDLSSPSQVEFIAGFQAEYMKTLQQLRLLMKRALQKASNEDLSVASAEDEIGTLLKAQKMLTVEYNEFAKVHRVDESIGKDKMPVLEIGGISEQEISEIRRTQEQQDADLLQELPSPDTAAKTEADA